MSETPYSVRHDALRMAALSKRLADQGKLVEAGWVVLRTHFERVPGINLDQLRYAYMAGAQHLFASIMTILEEGEEPTEKDLERVDLIHMELEAWAAEERRKMQARAH